jgi:spore germination protein PD
MLQYTVVNHEIKVGNIHSGGVSSSGLFVVGDIDFLILSSILDTPPESLAQGPFVPSVFDVPSTPA